MTNKYRCKICLDLFDSIQDVEYHLEHTDEKHEHAITKWGVPECFDRIEIDSLEEAQKTLEQSSGDKKTVVSSLKGVDQRIKDYAKMYPYPPYYRYGYGDEKGNYRYYCLDHDWETTDPKEFLQHLASSEEEKGDVRPWLQNHMKYDILSRIRNQKGSSMLLTDEDLDRYAAEELREFEWGLALQTPQPERLVGIVTTQHQKLGKFISGEISNCPLCGASTENLTGNAKDECLEKTILSQLNPSKGLEQIYVEKWNGVPIDTSLKVNIHLHLTHKEIYSSLFKSGTYTGGLPLWLSSESYLTREPMVEELMKSGVPTDKNLNPKEKAMLKWLGGK